MYLATDLSTSVGWAIGDGSARPRFGLISLKAGTEGAVYVRARRFFKELLLGHQIREIFNEAPVLGENSIQSRLVTFGIRAILHEVAFECQVPITEVAVSTWRSHFLGITQAPKHVPKKKTRDWLKKRAVDECFARGFGEIEHDIAEAIGILDHGLCLRVPAYGASAVPLFRAKQ